jgi:hypothetical protein
MAVTVNTQTVTATWTASSLRSGFEALFIANGEMTAWYDSFTVSGREYGVLEKTYDAGTYGKTYYVFKFTTTEIYCMICGGWDAVSHVPTGTDGVDYPDGWATSDAEEFGDFTLAQYINANTASVSSTPKWTLATNTNVVITSYKSGIDSNFRWYSVKNGANYLNFHIAPTTSPYVDYAYLFSGALYFAFPNQSADYSYLTFCTQPPGCDRGFPRNILVGADTTPTFIEYHTYVVQGGPTYLGAGDGSAINGNTPSSSTSAFYTLPIRGLGKGTLASFKPVCLGVPYNLDLSTLTLPGDFGMYSDLANNSIRPDDTLVVSAGVEEYTVIAIANNAGSTATEAFISFVCRTT